MYLKAELRPVKVSERTFKNKKGEDFTIFDIVFQHDESSSTICISAFKTMHMEIINKTIPTNNKLDVDFTLISKEYNGKYYTNVNIENIKEIAVTATINDIPASINPDELPF